jgi:hypothetical protein
MKPGDQVETVPGYPGRHIHGVLIGISERARAIVLHHNRDGTTTTRSVWFADLVESSQAELELGPERRKV